MDVGTVTAAALRIIRLNLIDPLDCRIRGMVRRAVWSSGSDGERVTGKVVTGSGEADDDYEGVELLLPHGIHTVPPDGSTCVVFSPDGDTAQHFAVAAGGGAAAPGDLASGEFSIAINGSAGPRITVRNSGVIEIKPATGQVVQMGQGPGPAVARVGDKIAVPAFEALHGLITGWAAVPPANAAAIVAALLGWANSWTAPMAASGTGVVATGGTGSTST